MSETKQNIGKNNDEAYKPRAINILAEKYGVSKDYIRKSLRGDRVGVFPDKMIREFKTAIDELKQADINILSK